MEEKKLITYYYGCMYSGKSKTILYNYFEELSKNKTINCFVPEHTKKDGFIVTRHSNVVEMPATKLKKFSDILNYNADVYIVDEIQFFNTKNLKDTLKILNERKKTVYLAGLDMDFNCVEWPTHKAIKNEKYIKKIHLTARCSTKNCENEAWFSKLVNIKKANDLIDDKLNEYKPVCGIHYMKD